MHMKFSSKIIQVLLHLKFWLNDGKKSWTPSAVRLYKKFMIAAGFGMKKRSSYISTKKGPQENYYLHFIYFYLFRYLFFCFLDINIRKNRATTSIYRVRYPESSKSDRMSWSKGNFHTALNSLEICSLIPIIEMYAFLKKIYRICS